MLDDLTDKGAEAVGAELKAMREARRALGDGDLYFSGEEAAKACPFDTSAEALLKYPKFILPRVPRKPGCPQAGYLIDPRDVAALPAVLRRWTQARERGDEQEFENRRKRQINERDEYILHRHKTRD